MKHRSASDPHFANVLTLVPIQQLRAYPRYSPEMKKPFPFLVLQKSNRKHAPSPKHHPFIPEETNEALNEGITRCRVTSLLLPAAYSDKSLQDLTQARAIMSKIESNTTGEPVVSPKKSIIEHCEATVDAVFALGLGSRRPRPIDSTSSAYLSSSKAKSMAEG